MIGNDLAKKLKKNKGQLYIPMLAKDDCPWILANKSDVIDWAVKQGYSETGMWVATDSINNVLYLEKE